MTREKKKSKTKTRQLKIQKNIDMEADTPMVKMPSIMINILQYWPLCFMFIVEFMTPKHYEIIVYIENFLITEGISNLSRNVYDPQMKCSKLILGAAKIVGFISVFLYCIPELAPGFYFDRFETFSLVVILIGISLQVITDLYGYE